MDVATRSADVESPEEVLSEATAGLIAVAARIERLCENSGSAVELIDASNAIHRALVELQALESAPRDGRPCPVLRDPHTAVGATEVHRPPFGGTQTNPTAPTPFSILDDDLIGRVDDMKSVPQTAHGPRVAAQKLR